MNYSTDKSKILNTLITTGLQKIPIWKSLEAIGDEPGMIGSIILNQDDDLLYYHDGITWTLVETTSITNIGQGEDLVVDSTIVHQLKILL